MNQLTVVSQVMPRVYNVYVYVACFIVYNNYQESIIEKRVSNFHMLKYSEVEQLTLKNCCLVLILPCAGPD